MSLLHADQQYVEKYDYVALGGMVGTGAQDYNHLTYLWKKYFTDKKGYPTIKVHGFGQGPMSLLELIHGIQ